MPFDLYLLDVWLPDGDGVELCRQLHELTPDTPVLYYTAAAYEADRAKALQSCGNDYLKKPACFADIQEAILRVLLKTQDQASTANGDL